MWKRRELDRGHVIPKLPSGFSASFALSGRRSTPLTLSVVFGLIHILRFDTVVMPVTTTAAAFHITPVVIKTFIRHARKKTHKLAGWNNDEEATDDILYDEYVSKPWMHGSRKTHEECRDRGLHIVRAFLDMATHNTVESLQALCVLSLPSSVLPLTPSCSANTHIPSPPWAAVSPIRIPLSCCNRAADTLVEWFGPEEIKVVVGGEKWWQVRGMDSVDGEWITERQYLSNAKPPSGMKLSAADLDIVRMADLETVMVSDVVDILGRLHVLNTVSFTCMEVSLHVRPFSPICSVHVARSRRILLWLHQYVVHGSQEEETQHDVQTHIATKS
jgi:hypothetical protein